MKQEEQVLDQIHRQIQRASDLMIKGSLLIERIIEISAESHKSGEFFMVYLKRLTHEEPTPSAIQTGRCLAQKVASAELEIRAIIGRPSAELHRYGWIACSASTTLMAIEQQIGALAQELAQTIGSCSRSENFANIIIGLDEMAGLARKNVATALDVANSAKVLQTAALDFLLQR